MSDCDVRTTNALTFLVVIEFRKIAASDVISLRLLLSRAIPRRRIYVITQFLWIFVEFYDIFALTLLQILLQSLRAAKRQRFVRVVIERGNDYMRAISRAY